MKNAAIIDFAVYAKQHASNETQSTTHLTSSEDAAVVVETTQAHLPSEDLNNALRSLIEQLRQPKPLKQTG